jgi:hypothetical protein
MCRQAYLYLYLYLYLLSYAHVIRFGVGELVDYSIVLFYA